MPSKKNVYELGLIIAFQPDQIQMALLKILLRICELSARFTLT